MITSIKQWFTPPVFEDDEEKTLRASLLNAGAITAILFSSLVIFGILIGGKTPKSTLLIDVFALTISLLLHQWLRRGKIEFAGIWLMTLGFILITGAIASLGTIRTPTTTNYLLLVVMSGVLFDLRGILTSTIASSMAVLGLILAENAGILPQPDYAVTVTQWITYTGAFGITGGLFFFTFQSMRKTITRAEREITERKRVEVELRKLTQAVEQSPASIAITDLKANIEYVNPRFTQVTGYGFDEVIGKKPSILKTDLTPAETYSQLWETITAGNEWRGEFVNRKKNGSLYYESAIISPITDLNGVFTHYLAVKEDITERKRAEEALQKANEQLQAHLTEIENLHTELREQALRDPLTGLYNRRYLSETIEREIIRAKREKNHLSVIMSDIDHFKIINDTYGHQVGDQFLLKIANLMKKHARGSDIVCRYGGEEFLLVLPATTVKSAAKRAEEIRQKCKKIIIQHEGKDVSITLSFGVACYPTHGQAVDEIITKADKAMYQSKHSGRNKVTTYLKPSNKSDSIALPPLTKLKTR